MGIRRKSALLGLSGAAKTLDRVAVGLQAGAEWLRHVRFNALYRARPDDIFVVTYPKSGTTWAQMILYQLLTDGDMNIPHLNRFAPYLDDILRGCAPPPPRVSTDAAGPAGSGWNRRVVKTHASYRLVPKGCGKYIYVVRDGRDVAVSYYYHHKRSGYPKGFPEFISEFFEGKVRFGRWIDHVREWTENGAGLKVLFVRFEDLLADLRTSVSRIAEFCEVLVPDAAVPRILHRCSFEFMQAHEEKLDVRTRLTDGIVAENDRFVRRGRSGDWTAHFDERMTAEYSRTLAKAGGLPPLLMSYAPAPSFAGQIPDRFCPDR